MPRVGWIHVVAVIGIALVALLVIRLHNAGGAPGLAGDLVELTTGPERK